MLIFMVIVLYINPRLMLHDYPRDVQETVPNMSPQERRKTALVAAPLLLLMFGTPLAFALSIVGRYPSIPLVLRILNTSQSSQCSTWSTCS